MCRNPWLAVAGATAVVLVLTIGRVAEAGSGALLGLTPLVAASLQARGQDIAARPIDVHANAKPRATRPRILIPLYSVFAGLQFADAHSTYSAMQRGIGESNPLMMGLAGSPAGLATAKLATTAQGGGDHHDCAERRVRSDSGAQLSRNARSLIHRTS